jgi:streptomycin 6-kinase
VLRELHSVPQPTNHDGLFPLQQWFQELFKKAEADEHAGNESIFVRGAKVAEKLLAAPRDVRVLHGDIHHRNIRHHAERGWLAFDPKGVVGERTYDCANTLCNPPETPELVHSEARLLTNAKILAEGLEIELARVLAFTFAYACLSASWSLSIDEDEVAQWMLKVATIVEPHVTQP